MKNQFFACTGDLFPRSTFNIIDFPIPYPDEDGASETAFIGIKDSVVTVKVLNEWGYKDFSKYRGDWKDYVLWKANWVSSQFFSALSFTDHTLYATRISKVESWGGDLLPFMQEEDARISG